MRGTKKLQFRTLDMVLVAVFVALMAIGANITSFLVIGGVPVTLQALFSILAGALLGSRLGALAMFIYLLVGLAGAPVFAQFTGGLAILVKPTFGFILCFILVAFLTGLIIEKGKEATIRTFFIACYVGLFVTYLLGTHYMYFAYGTIASMPEGFTYHMLWSWMIGPFIKDLIVTGIGAFIAYRVYHATNNNVKSSWKSAS